MHPRGGIGRGEARVRVEPSTALEVGHVLAELLELFGVVLEFCF